MSTQPPPPFPFQSGDARSDLLDTVLENIPYAISIFDADLKLVKCNQMYLDILLLPENLGVPGTHIVNFLRINAELGVYGPGNIETLVNEQLSTIESRKHQTFERVRPDGRVVEVTIKPLPDDSLLITCEMLTTRQQGEAPVPTHQQITKELALAASRFRDFANTAADWFWEMGPDLRFSYLSDRHEELSGIPASHYIGKTRYESSFEDGGDANWRQHQDDLDNRRSFHDFRFSRHGEDGQIQYISTSGKPVFDQNEIFLGYRGSAVDISAEVKIRRSLQQAKELAEFANRSKTAFLANVSHELRTPLNAIIGFSEIMTSEALGKVQNPIHLSYVTDINQAGTHLLEVINDILDVARIEAGELEIHDEIIDLELIAEACINMVWARAQKADIKITLDIPKDFPHLQADKTRVKQTLLNVVTNAVKFSDKGSTISLRAHLISDSINIVISDSGIGIANDDLENIFEPFTQVQDVLTRPHEGSGLGLALVKSMMEMHGGTVSIDSVLGEGTIVSLTFPLDRTVLEKQYSLDT